MTNNNHFNLTLDTVAPVGSISGPQYTNNAAQKLSVEIGDATYMKLWYDNKSANPAVADLDSNTGYTGASWVLASTTSDALKLNFSANGTFYYHMVLMDTVGNKSVYTTANSIIYDTVKPQVGEVRVLDTNTTENGALTNNTSIIVRVSFSDAAPSSGCTNITVSGDITNTPLNHTITADELKNGYADIYVTLSGTDGVKTISATVSDATGNVSTSKSDVVRYDHTPATGTLLLYQAGTTTQVPSYINKTKQKFDASISLNGRADTDDDQLEENGALHDIVGYKIWGDFSTTTTGSATAKPSSYSTSGLTGASKTVKVANLYFTDTDAVKNVYVELIDRAGNVTAYSNNSNALTKSITYDNTAPAVSLTPANAGWISKVTGYTSVTLTGEYNANIAGFNAYTWKLNGVEQSSTGKLTASVKTNTWVIDSTSLVEGVNTFELSVTDKAGNVGKASATVYLDTTAPNAPTIATISGWHNDIFPITVSCTDKASGTVTGGSGILNYQVWSSTTATDTTVPANTTVVPFSTATNQTISAASINFGTPAQSETANYIHVKVTDAVGNVSYGHAQYAWDTIKPENPKIKHTLDAVNSPSVTVSFEVTDATSGVYQMLIWGAVTGATSESSATWESFASTKSITLTKGDGYKQVYVKFRDKAGNITDAVSLTNNAGSGIELDTTSPHGAGELRTTDKSAAIPAKTAVHAFKVLIDYSDDARGGVQYKLFSKDSTNSLGKGVIGGDYFALTDLQTTGLDAKDVAWLDCDTSKNGIGGTHAMDGIFDSGHTINSGWYAMYRPADKSKEAVEATFYFTANASAAPTTKHIYIAFKDNAGNISLVDLSTVFMDQKPEPEPEPDYDRVSCVHVHRFASVGVENDKYCDEILISFTMTDQPIQAWKFVAYKDQAAAAAGSEKDAAIGTANGSSGMTGGSLALNTLQVCKLTGKDYRAALGGSDSTNKDGLHIVVLYVQNEAGIWSDRAIF